MNNPSPSYATCQKCGMTLQWVCSVDGAGSYCWMCAEELSRKDETYAPHGDIPALRASVERLLPIVTEVSKGYCGYGADKHHFCLFCGRHITPGASWTQGEEEHNEECIVIRARNALTEE